MPTFDNLVSQVKQQILGYTRDQASVSHLTAAMGATDTTFMVDTETVTNLSRGLCEIDDELILIKKYERGSGTVTVFAGENGRGQEGTEPASHADNTFVIDDPRFPRIRIKQALNDTIRASYPDLFVLDDVEFPYIAARWEYPIPSEADNVYKVVVNTVGPSGVWRPVTHWRFNAMASTGEQTKPTPTPTGKSLQVYQPITPGRNLRVSYTKAPAPLVSGSDDFSGVTGFPDRFVDLMTYGAAWRLLSSYEAARLQQSSIESTERAPLVPTGAAADASQYFLAMYQRRLAEERDRLLELFATYQHFNA